MINFHINDVYFSYIFVLNGLTLILLRSFTINTLCYCYSKQLIESKIFCANNKKEKLLLYARQL